MTGYREDLPALQCLKIAGLFTGRGFTLHDGQRDIDSEIEQLKKGFLPPQIGQWDFMF